jgi:DNA-binding beta-propeller fold protein YncE
MSSNAAQARSPDRTPPPLMARIDPPAAQALARLGRTEDVRLSPDNRRLAVAGYAANTCLLLDIKIAHESPTPQIHITGATELTSDDLCEPHGFDFVDNDTLVVGNRMGSVVVFDLPQTSTGSLTLTATHRITRANWLRRIHSPGSVLVNKVDSDGYELLVCNNYRKRITRHRIRRDGRIQNSMALKKRMAIPDGLTKSRDGHWLAISNHATHSVLVYDQRRKLSPRTNCSAELTGVAYPHGLRFSPDGRHLFVADAGAPLVHVYHAPDSTWNGPRPPSHNFRVLPDQTFEAAHVNPSEGGPKGLEIDANGTILIVTCESQPLTFFSVADLI